MDAQTFPVSQAHPIDGDVTAAYLANQPSLQRYARSLTRDEDAAADICQDVFVRLLVVARAGRMPDAPGAWSTSERMLDRLSESELLPSTEDAVIGRERDALVRLALAGVRPAEREAMVLAAQGYHAAEIGHRLGRSAQATRTLLCRARGGLRLELQALEAS
jgi:RNA polymerase sigma-70 factor (ECF subfamily)